MAAGFRLGQPGAPDSAGDHHGERAGRDSDPHGPHFHAGGVRPGLHPHGASERAAGAHGGVPPRLAQRHDSGADGGGIAVWSAAGRRHRDGDDIFLAGNRAADHSGDFQPRLLPGGRLHPGNWPDVRSGKFSDGFAVFGGESADKAVINAERYSASVYAMASVAQATVSHATSEARGGRRNWLAITGVALVAVFVVFALFAPWIAPQDPAHIELTTRLAPPSAAHWCGTDELGRDILSRLIYGARISMLVGSSVVLGALLLGLVIGSIAGYYGGKIDRFVNVILMN